MKTIKNSTELMATILFMANNIYNLKEICHGIIIDVDFQNSISYKDQDSFYTVLGKKVQIDDLTHKQSMIFKITSFFFNHFMSSGIDKIYVNHMSHHIRSLDNIDYNLYYDLKLVSQEMKLSEFKKEPLSGLNKCSIIYDNMANFKDNESKATALASCDQNIAFLKDLIAMQEKAKNMVLDN